jgi:hypothetical protein
MKNGAANDNAAPQDDSARGMVAAPIWPRIEVAPCDLIFPVPALFGLADDLRKIFRAPFPADRDPTWCKHAKMRPPWKN